MDEYLRAVGRISNSFNDLEGLLHDYVWWLIDGIDPVGMVVTAGLGMVQTLGMARRIAEYRYRDNEVALAAIGHVLAKVDEARISRNGVVHSSILGPYEDGTIRSHRRDRKGPRHDTFAEVAVDSLDAVATEIEAVSGELMLLQMNHGVQVPVPGQPGMSTLHPPSRYPHAPGYVDP